MPMSSPQMTRMFGRGASAMPRGSRTPTLAGKSGNPSMRAGTPHSPETAQAGSYAVRQNWAMLPAVS